MRVKFKMKRAELDCGFDDGFKEGLPTAAAVWEGLTRSVSRISADLCPCKINILMFAV